MTPCYQSRYPDNRGICTIKVPLIGVGPYFQCISLWGVICCVFAQVTEALLKNFPKMLETILSDYPDDKVDVLFHMLSTS